MIVARALAAWMQDQLLAEPVFADRVVSIASTDTAPADQFAIYWEEVEIDPVCPPLHIYDLEYQIRRPTNLDLPGIEDLEAWCLERFTPARLASLTSAIASLNVGLALRCWWVGDATTDNDRDTYRHTQDLRLSIERA